MSYWIALAISALTYLVAFVVFVTKIGSKTDQLKVVQDQMLTDFREHRDQLNSNLAASQNRLHDDLTRLLTTMNQREVAEERAATKIATLETEVAGLRAWRHNLPQTNDALLGTIALRLEKILNSLDSAYLRKGGD